MYISFYLKSQLIKLMKVLKLIDQHSIPIKLHYNNSTKFGSVIGGSVTLILYSIALAYTIYVFYLWRSMQILPKIQVKTNTLENYRLNIDQYIISIGLVQTFTQNINPFQRINNIITPYIIRSENNETQVFPFFSDENQQRPLVYFNNITIYTKNGNPESVLIMNDIQKVQNMIAFTKCNQSLIMDAGLCASNEEIENYFQYLPPILDLNVYLSQYDPKSQQLQTLIKTEYLALSNNISNYNQLMLFSKKLIINQGILFDDYSEQILFSDYQFVSQSVQGIIICQYAQDSYFVANFGYDFLSVVMLRLDNLQNEDEWVYPKLGEVLAQIGSIISIIFIVKELFISLNEYILENDLIYELMLFKFPTFKDITLKKNVRGDIIQASYKNSYTYNLQQFRSFYNEKQTQFRQIFNIDTLFKNQLLLQHLISQQQSFQKEFQESIPCEFEMYSRTVHPEINLSNSNINNIIIAPNLSQSIQENQSLQVLNDQ